MQFFKNKLAAVTICLLLTLSIATSFLLAGPVSAHTPAWQIPTHAFINVSPDPVGVGQLATVVVWLAEMPDLTSINNEVRFKNFKLTITKPDGTTETKTWDIVWDTTSSAAYQFTPSVTGVYTLKFEFPGQVYDYTGLIQQWFAPPAYSNYVNDTYLPSSATTTLTVQNEPVPNFPASGAPAEYWTRPIDGQNTAWASIASNYLDPFIAAYSNGALRLQPDGTAPASAHVLWTKPISFGGVVGGSNTGVNGATFYPGLSYETKFNSPIIIYDRLFYGLPRSNEGSGGGYICVDLKTGEEIWRQNYAVNPSFASLEWFDSPNQHGVVPNGYLWAVSGGFNFMTFQMDPTTWTAYDPWDGNQLFAITDVPDGTRGYGPSGEPLIYQFDVANKWLALWNVTSVITNGAAGALTFGGYAPVGQTFNSTLRDSYSWNVTLPSTMPADSTVCYAINNDVLFGCAHIRNVFGQKFFGGVADDPYTAYGTFWAINLKEGSRGNLIWMKDFPAPAGNISRMLGPVDAESRVFFLSDKETMQWSGYDLDNGEKLWGPIGDTRDFNYYPTVGSGGVSQVGYVAYGNMYTGGYGGEIFCYDSRTGALEWKYNNTSSGLESPYGLFPTFISAIADGKVYLYNNEHSPNSPIYKGARARCVNASTGEEIWTLLSWAGVGGFADEGWPVADGMISYLNAYDMQVYTLGKGPSAITVDAPAVAITLGSSLVIRGTVTDISAGTAQNEQIARFPNGVPAVSDESMGVWMEYVYMQQDRPIDVTGVEVTLSVLDANNNYRTIGTTTSNSDGFFTFNWKPDIEGPYTVYASFAGSDSYWPSHAVTSFAVDPAPESTPEPTQAPVSMADQYLLPATGGIIAAVAIVGALIVLLLRKK